MRRYNETFFTSDLVEQTDSLLDVRYLGFGDEGRISCLLAPVLALVFGVDGCIGRHDVFCTLSCGNTMGCLFGGSAWLESNEMRVK